MHGTGDEPISRQEDGDFGHAGDGFWLQVLALSLKIMWLLEPLEVG